MRAIIRLLHSVFVYFWCYQPSIDQFHYFPKVNFIHSNIIRLTWSESQKFTHCNWNGIQGYRDTTVYINFPQIFICEILPSLAYNYVEKKWLYIDSSFIIPFSPIQYSKLLNKVIISRIFHLCKKIDDIIRFIRCEWYLNHKEPVHIECTQVEKVHG